MQQPDRDVNARQIAGRRKPCQSRAVVTTPHRGPPLCRETRLRQDADRSGSDIAEAVVEFGGFRWFQVLLRQRQLVADSVPVELGSRAFDLLLALLEADGALVTKDELMRRVWRGIVVSEENLKVQICAVRKALGADRDIIRTEVGRGYRFTAMLRRTAAVDARQYPTRPRLKSERTFLRRSCRQSLRVLAAG